MKVFDFALGILIASPLLLSVIAIGLLSGAIR